MASVHKRKVGTKRPWEVRYFADGKHKSKSFELKRHADEFRRRVEYEASDGPVVAGNRLTVAALCEQFMRFQEERLRDGRIGRGAHTQFRIAVDTSIVPAIGTVKVQDLSLVVVERLYSTMCGAGELMPSTARDRVSVLGAIEDFAVRRRLARDRVVPDALKALRGVKAPPIRTFSHDDMTAVLKAAQVRRGTFRGHLVGLCAIHLAAFCGMRWGEIMGLTLENVDFERRLIRVRHSLTQWDELKGPKTRAGRRDVHVPAHIVELLRRWAAEFYIENERGLLFRTRFSGRISSGSFYVQVWWPILKRAGLWKEGDNLHFHALRHFAASWMIQNGLPVTEVAFALGHSHFDTTLQTYAHPVMAAHRRVEIMDEMASRLALASQRFAPLTIAPPTP